MIRICISLSWKVQAYENKPDNWIFATLVRIKVQEYHVYRKFEQRTICLLDGPSSSDFIKTFYSFHFPLIREHY